MKTLYSNIQVNNDRTIKAMTKHHSLPQNTKYTGQPMKSSRHIKPIPRHNNLAFQICFIIISVSFVFMIMLIGLAITLWR